MSEKEECRCARCTFGSALRAASVAFMDRAQSEGGSMVTAGVDLARILSFETSFQATAIVNAAGNPPVMAGQIAAAMAAGSSKGACRAAEATGLAREAMAAGRPH